jgi:hypothetical protein
LESQPSSHTGGIEETSASFEARSAPRSYATPIGGHQRTVGDQAAAFDNRSIGTLQVACAGLPMKRD